MSADDTSDKLSAKVEITPFSKLDGTVRETLRIPVERRDFCMEKVTKHVDAGIAADKLLAARKQPRTFYGQYWALFLFALAVHNVEEVLLGLPEWSTRHSPIHFWTPVTFLWVTVVVWLTAFVCMCVVVRRQSWSRYGLLAVSGVMLLNSLWHIGLSLLSRSYMPGVLTAMMTLLPVCGAIVVVLIRKKKLSHTGEAK